MPDEKEVKRRVGVVHVVTAAVLSGILTVLSLIGGIAIPFGPGVSVFYPAAPFFCIVPLWFGFWGFLAVAIGGLIGNYLAGYPMFLALFAMTPANLVLGLIPWAAFKLGKRDPSLTKTMDYAFWIVFAAIAGSFVSGFVGISLMSMMGLITPTLFLPMWLSWGTTDFILAIVIGIPVLKVATKAVMKSRAYVEGFFA